MRKLSEQISEGLVTKIHLEMLNDKDRSIRYGNRDLENKCIRKQAMSQNFEERDETK